MSNSSIKTIHAWEPWFFLFFGIFHLHRIWALIDRESYASFWMGILESKGWPYWNVVWGFFIVLGGLVFVLGLSLLKNKK